jgi:hypothetical protein
MIAVGPCVVLIIVIIFCHPCHTSTLYGILKILYKAFCMSDTIHSRQCDINAEHVEQEKVFILNKWCVDVLLHCTHMCCNRAKS